MSKKIAITGAEGTIGTVIRDQLPDKHEITPIDVVPEVEEHPNGRRLDVSEDYDSLKQILKRHDTVFHLAWNLSENYNTEDFIAANRHMFENVYRAGKETDVRKVVTASSIHAIDMKAIFNQQPYSDIARGKRGASILDSSQLIGFEGPLPQFPYGWGKRSMEYRGRHHSGEDLFVACVRFGGVNPDDNPDYPGAHKPVNYYPSVYLSHDDTGSLARRLVELEPSNFENKFQLLYGISDNTRAAHDLSNNIGWTPEDDSEDKLREYWDPMED